MIADTRGIVYSAAAMPTVVGASARLKFRFSLFEVDPEAQELRKSGLRLKLQPQPFQILLLLLGRAGEIVSREELRASLWPAETYVEFDRSLNRAVVKLREALGDSAESPRYIETVPKRGYRFIAPVSRSVPQAVRPAPAEGFRKRLPLRLLGVGLAGIGVLFAVYLLVRRIERRAPTAAIRSLVVLPLQDLSREVGQEYFADGVTDELTTDLAQIQSLRVISRTTAMHYKGTKLPLPQIARELGVDAAVEGSVSRSENKIRIRAQLVRGATDEHVWASSYERDLGDAIVLQAELARDIADQIHIRLGSREESAFSARKPVNPQAYEAYLKGRHFFDKRLLKSNAEAEAYFRQAIATDPNFAPAHAGLADALVSRSYYGAASPADVMPQAKSMIARALALDPNLPDAHVSLGWIKLTYDWDWLGVEEEIKRALERNPNSATARQLYGNYFLALGRIDDATAELQRARELDPLSLFINRDLGRAFYYARRFDDALKQFQQTLDLDSSIGGATYEWVGWCFEKKGLRNQAVDAFLQGKLTDGATQASILEAGRLYKREGWEAFWRRELNWDRNPVRDATNYMSVLNYARIGDKERALKLLKYEVDLHTAWVTWMNIDPELEGLRSDSRFRQMLRATGR
jgi:TolB-like protein/DNA-binding winged helix-turn-helix (wHTH) protein/Tfp pilus assembly protein PilF